MCSVVAEGGREGARKTSEEGLILKPKKKTRILKRTRMRRALRLFVCPSAFSGESCVCFTCLARVFLLYDRRFLEVTRLPSLYALLEDLAIPYVLTHAPKHYAPTQGHDKDKHAVLVPGMSWAWSCDLLPSISPPCFPPFE